jgi:hypothetical protein
MKHAFAVCLLLALLSVPQSPAGEESPAPVAAEDHLVILWTSGDREVFTKVVFPYALNSMKQEWWKEVTLIVWGPSARLAASDEELQGQLRKVSEAGVRLTACKWCSDQYEVSDRLAELGIDVKYMGKPLTEFLKSDASVIVF